MIAETQLVSARELVADPENLILVEELVVTIDGVMILNGPMTEIGVTVSDQAAVVA